MNRLSVIVSLAMLAMVFTFCAVIGALDLLQHAGIIPPAR